MRWKLSAGFLLLAAAFANGNGFAAPVLQVRPAAPLLAVPRMGAADKQRLDALNAAHRRAKAQLSQENITDLDFIRERARSALGSSPAGDLMAAALRTVNATVPGLSAREARALAEYVLADIAAMQETQMSFNLQYLQLQSQMQNESRSYTAVSNIMKTKHDTVKNAISNIR